MIEPARDVSGNCVIYTGAELAWAANQVNQGPCHNEYKDCQRYRFR